MPLSHDEANEILAAYVGKASTYNKPSSFFVALSTSIPNETGNVNEPGDSSYARIEIVETKFTDAAASATETNVDIVFPQATEETGWASGADFVALAFYGTLTGVDEYLGWAEFTTNKPVNKNDTAKILNGDLDIAFA